MDNLSMLVGMFLGIALWKSLEYLLWKDYREWLESKIDSKKQTS